MSTFYRDVEMTVVIKADRYRSKTDTYSLNKKVTTWSLSGRVELANIGGDFRDAKAAAATLRALANTLDPAPVTSPDLAEAGGDS